MFGLATGSLATHVVARHEALVPIPATVGFEAACTAPTVFLTAHAAFMHASACSSADTVKLLSHLSPILSSTCLTPCIP